MVQLGTIGTPLIHPILPCPGSSLFVAKIVGMHSVGTSSFAMIARYRTPSAFLSLL